MKKLLLAISSLFIYNASALPLKQSADSVSMHQWVDSVMNTLNTPEKQLGQLIMPLYYMPQATAADVQEIRDDIKNYHLGGILLSKGTLATHAMFTNAAQDQAKSEFLPPLMMAIDGEWGLAMRLKDAIKYPRNGVLTETLTDAHLRDSLLYAYGLDMARQCREMGIQVNFAPVLDVNSNPKNPVIGNRSFGNNPTLVAQCAIAYAKGLEDGGILSVGKHFPGHGDTSTDSHTTLPTLKHSRARLDSIELSPFQQYIDAQLGGIMTAHLDVPALTKQKGAPASASHAVVTGLLRDQMKFDGLVFTDGLAMQGARKYPNVCIEALKAGNDILVQPYPLKQEMTKLHAALHNGQLDTTMIAEKCRRVLEWKYKLGLTSFPAVIDTVGLTRRVNTPSAIALCETLSSGKIQPNNSAAPADIDPTLQAALKSANYADSTARPQRQYDKKFREVDSLIYAALDKETFPGCQILIAQHGKILFDKCYGWMDADHSEPVTDKTIYDLASVSKAAATVPAIMHAIDKHDIHIYEPISKYLTELRGTDKERLTIQQALMHETGMKEGFGFYSLTFDTLSYEGKYYSTVYGEPFTVQQDKRCWFDNRLRYDSTYIVPTADADHQLQVSAAMYVRNDFRDTILARTLAMPLKRPGRYRYSDLNFVMLRGVIERVSGMRLDEYLYKEMPELYNYNLCYNPLQMGHQINEIAPTEIDEALHRYQVRGTVHDEVAAWAGGVDGNAGLFGNTHSLLPVLQMMLDGGKWNGKQIIKPSIWKVFVSRRSKVSRRGLGFDKPEFQPGKPNPCAPTCSSKVFGHTGYSGTCFWIDPDKDLIFIFLCNRICPHRWNDTLTRENIRPTIQQAIYKSIK